MQGNRGRELVEQALAGTGDISLRAVRPLDEYEPPEGFQPTGLFNLEGYEQLSAAIIYRPPNVMGEQGVLAGIGEALSEAWKAERRDASGDEDAAL